MRRRRVSHVLDRQLTALEKYRCVRDQLRGEQGSLKQRELCDELDRLWWSLDAGERKVLSQEFTEYERARFHSPRRRKSKKRPHSQGDSEDDR